MAMRDWWGEAERLVNERLAVARPAWRLLWRDRAAMRAWARYRGAVAEALGEGAAERYTRCIVRVAEVDGEIARTLALTIPDQLPRIREEGRERYFEHLERLIGERPEALPMVARALPELLGGLDDGALAAFLKEGVGLHARSQQQAEAFLRQESEVGRGAARRLQRGVTLEEVGRVLGLYAQAHCGADVQIRGGRGQAFSDGHHIYLPEQIDRYGATRSRGSQQEGSEEDDNFKLYRVLTAQAAGYLEFGTFDLRLDRLPAPVGGWPEAREGEGEVERFFRAFPNRSLARDLFQILEDARIEAHIRAEYPGVARDLEALGAEAVAQALRGEELAGAEGAAARAVAALARRVRGLDPADRAGGRAAGPEKQAGQAGASVDADGARIAAAVEGLAGRIGALRGGGVEVVAAAVAEAYPAFEELMRRAEDRPPGPGRQGAGDRQGAEQRPQVPQRIRPEAARPEDRAVEEQARRRWERGEEGPQEARQRVREEARQAQRSAEDRARREELRARDPARQDRQDRQGAEGTEGGGLGGAVVPPEADRDPWQKTGARPEADPDLLPGERIFRYREWDSAIGDYKPDWVVVRERRLREGPRGYVDEVMQRHLHRVRELRRRFEALRPQAMVREDRRWDGPELDLDQLITDRIDRRVRGAGEGRVYAREVRARRDVAVAFLLDMSSSTNESADGSARRIIDVEKESLILAAEAIHALGDGFAIFGFSGYGRSQVQFYVAKDFAERWDDAARARVGRIGFKMENRDGAAIRHAAARLSAWPARTRLLIHISDGKPLDCGCDHYYDRYAQEDTRVALREARQAGIHPFCITVDPTARAYLPRMFGEVAYTVIDRVELLPGRLVQVYRRLAV